MAIQSVSFGRVTAVTGNRKKTDKLKSRMQPSIKTGDALFFDVTQKYLYAPTDGAIAKAVSRGERANMYVTGQDVKSVVNKEKNWSNQDEILSHLSQYVDLNQLTLNQAINRIV